MNHVNAIMGYIGQAAGIVTRIVGWALLLLIAAAVMQRYGFRVPYVPATGATELAWLCGAWFLWRGGKL